MDATLEFKPGSLVKARGREWVVLPETRPRLLRLRPLGGADDDATLIYLPLEPESPRPATFDPPDPDNPGSRESALLLRDALRLKLRAGAGPFRSFGNLNFVPRAYQLAPLLIALRQDTIRLLIADDVGIGKTIEAGIIARELLDRGEIDRLTVICPPHLCEQWQRELSEKFSIGAEAVRPGTAKRLERGLRPDESIFEAHPFTVVSLDYIKSDRRRDDFLRACPGFVIVDEAHTCVQANTSARHQRYHLLRGLAESEPRRNMVLLTATPHSGDDAAFHNLLALLHPRFRELAEMPEGSERKALRDELADHFVQRRRGDIAEWKDDNRFPIRESKESCYRLKGEWERLFEDVLAYARTLVKRTEGGSKLEQRMSWWAALALLRCLSSSPAAASQALNTRLLATEGSDEQERIETLDSTAIETVMDETVDHTLALKEGVPAGTLESMEDTKELCELIKRADALRGPGQDPKIKKVIAEVKGLVSDGFRPVIFCRYIATAHYLHQKLAEALPPRTTHVKAITGELTSDHREAEIESFRNLEAHITPVLIATDCLSEGINLQNHFNAVVHYDLTWNPTRHEQREGRADRFGQSSPKVRTLMLYGENNPVDGAVLRVILRKAERIRKELGVAVPMPSDNSKVIEAIMKDVLHQDRMAFQLSFDFGDTEAEVDRAWETAKGKMTRTVFAQRRIKPEEVMPEWRKAVSVCGGEDDVARFVDLAASYLGAPLGKQNGCFRLPVPHLPKPIQDRLSGIEFEASRRLAFQQPPPSGAIHIHRAHPLVSLLADHVVEMALNPTPNGFLARASAMFTSGVTIRTALYLLRLRSQIRIARQAERNGSPPILAEECLGVALRGVATPELLPEAEALALLSLEPGRNMEKAHQSHLLHKELERLPTLRRTFESIANQRAEQLLADHRRIRDASGTQGRYEVTPSLPLDVMGVYLFLPMARTTTS